MPKILIVDDDSGLRQIYSRYFSGEGFQVLEAWEAGQVLTDFSNEPIDVVLLDIRMPAFENHDMIPTIRSTHPGAKIIVSSCYDLDYQKEKVRNADDYFNKAEGCRELLSKIKTLLTRKETLNLPKNSQTDNDEVKAFIYSVSHDLHEPLSKIITISELLTEKLKDIGESERDYLLRLHEAGKRMKTLIENLSDQWLSKRKK